MGEARAWAARLEALGLAVRRHLAVAAGEAADLRRPVAQEGGDQIFEIDRHAEAVVLREIRSWPDECKPFWLICEGLGPQGRQLVGDPAARARYRVIVDPIDGTRALMYDKRPGWFLAAVAHDLGEHTRLAGTFAAAMVELPTSKQRWSDSYTATSDEPTSARRGGLESDLAYPLEVRPSAAPNLLDGFAQVSNFFPGTKVLASELMEHIVRETLPRGSFGVPRVYEDQYLSSGGQMVELMCGHDRFSCDLRPLFNELQEAEAGYAERLECHPYDLAGQLVAKQAGVVLTDGFGRPLDCPLDTTTGVHWCGYANQSIADRVRPVITDWLRRRGLRP